LLLLKKIEEIAGDNTVFCTGDFNATPDDEPIQILRNDGRLKDSYLISVQPPYGTEGTFNALNLNSPMKGRIDYIWVTEGVKVNKYGVLNELPYARFPSDHFPVMINVTF
jgi:endonuclease/exonuclease/phosphatase family metal-dependent hydrolase